MKLLRIVSILAVAVVTAATPFSQDDTVVTGVDVPARGKLLGRDGGKKCGPSGSCYGFMKRCNFLDCKNFTIECDNWCNDRLCTIGPDVCRKGGECAAEYHCDGSDVAREGLTEASITARDLESVTEVSSQEIEGSTHDAPLTDQENSKEQECPKCDSWLKDCRIADCTKPSSPACRERCQATLCAVGPAMCRKAGTCGRYTGCGVGQERPPVPISPDAQVQVDNLEISARSDPENDQAPHCPSCNDWMKQCKKTSCARPWAPECQWDCQRRLCKDGPNECRQGGSCAQCGKAVINPPAPDAPIHAEDRRSTSDDHDFLDFVKMQGALEGIDCMKWYLLCVNYCKKPDSYKDCFPTCRGNVCRWLGRTCLETPLCK